MKKIGKWLALQLAAALILALLPAGALAAEEQEEPTEPVEQTETAGMPEEDGEEFFPDPVPAEMEQEEPEEPAEQTEPAEPEEPAEEPPAEEPTEQEEPAEELSAEDAEKLAEEELPGEEPPVQQSSEEPETSGEASAEPSEEPEEDGEPVTEYDGVFSFMGTFQDFDVSESYHYEDAFFTGSSHSYNHSLARLSLAAALSSYSVLGRTLPASETQVYNYEGPLDLRATAAGHIVSMLEDCGFRNVMVNRDYLITTAYDKDSNRGENIGICIGRKTLEDGTTLLAVAVRSGGYGCEWISNFNVYNPDGLPYHIGFENAAEKVVGALEDYVAAQEIEGPVKVWLSGYSRGAAVTNLAAAALCRSGLAGCELTPENVYGYTFETPRGACSGDLDAGIYDGIWNIVSVVDIVTYVVMEQWGYGRYGHTLFTPCAEQDPALYAAYAPEVLAKFNAYRGEADADMLQIRQQAYFLIGLVDELCTAIPSDASLRTYLFQIAMRQLLRISYRSESADSNESVYKEILVMVLAAASGGSSAAELSERMNTVMVGHFPELCLAWMNTIPASALAESGTMAYCSVDMTGELRVFDDSGVLQFTACDGEILREDGALIDAVEEDGAWVVCIPGSMTARLEMTATEDGVLNLVSLRSDLPSNVLTETGSYSGVSVRAGETCTAVVSDTGCVLELSPGGAPAIALSEDGGTASVTGDAAGLYVRVALIIETGGQTGLYVTQAEIGEDGVVAIPHMEIPGITVTGVNAALVDDLDSLTSATPSIIDMDFMKY